MAPEDDRHPNEQYAAQAGVSPAESVPPHVSPAELQQQQSSGQGGAVSTGGSVGTVPGTIRSGGAEGLSEDELRQLARERNLDDSGSEDELRERLTGRIATGAAPEPEVPQAPGTEGAQPEPAPSESPAAPQA